MRRKLKAYCFQDRALDFLCSYLCNRSGRVHIGSVTSSWGNMERGFPQESVLGQLLRNIFQNELSYNVDSTLSMYPDDHQIYEKGKTCTVLAKLLGPVVQRPISSNPGLNFNPAFFISLFKSLLGKIFTILFRTSNDQIASKKIWTEFSLKVFRPEIKFHTNPGLP